MTENQMTVSSIGLLSINRKIADLRKYNSILIDTIGNPSIINNYACDFNNTSYLYKSSLNILGSELTIFSSGNYYSYEKEQVLWFLSGENNLLNNAILQFSSSTASVIIDSRKIISISHLNLTDNSSVKSIVNISNNKCSLILNVDGIIYKKEKDLEIPTDIANLNKLYIGNDPTDLEEYWCGTVNLDSFSIYENNTLVYSPSSGYSFSFSKILLSDGEFSLADDTVPIAKHVFRVDFEEIHRTGNNIVFSAQIDENTKLTIKEVGLYITIDNKDVLFGIIKGLNIEKGSDVPYDLIFTLSTSVEFVNVTGFPDENSFILKSFPAFLLKDFKLLREIVFYVISSLERMVYENAQRIGYNKAQEYYQLQQNLELDESCCSNIYSYSKLKKKLKIRKSYSFTLDNIVQIYGNPYIEENGETSNFSTSNYIYSNIKAPSNEEWESLISFKINSLSFEDRVIATFVTSDETDEGGINGLKGFVLSSKENKLFATMLSQDKTSLILDNQEILETYLNKPMYLKIRHTLNRETGQHIYTFLKSEDNISFKETYSVITEDAMISTWLIFIGGQADYHSDTATYTISKPFTNGTVYLAECYVKCGDYEWNNLKENILNDSTLLQYYAIPNLPRLSYKIEDINSSDYCIDVIENSMQGNKDLIEFSSDEGFSLGIKVHLKTSNPKLLLAKTDLSDNVYFTLTYFNRYLTFTLYGESPVSVTKRVEFDEFSMYQSNPIMLYFIIDKEQNLKFYKNNELLAISKGVSNLHEGGSTFLTNFVRDDVLNQICNQPEILENDTLEEFTEKVRDNQGRYIQNILVANGALTSDSMYYINNLMDTNF